MTRRSSAARPGSSVQFVAVHGRVACMRSHTGARPDVPLLLVHGIGCSSEAFGPVLARMSALAEPRPAIAPDMPGFGRSAGPRRALDMEALADWLRELLEVLAVPRVHVVGHSMGCQVALALARQAPTRAASVTLIGPTTGDQFEGVVRYGLGLAADSLFESMGWNWTLTRMALQMGMRRYVPTLGHMLRDHPIARAGEVTCPVLVVRGARDWIIRRDVARRLAAALPRGRYLEIPRGAHALQFNLVDEFLAALGPFVAAAERET